ncbi:MAG: autoinducer binding domain-containing protein [Paracoccaceae bacterium]|uniref:helix-turn-helix transcriptional regulator n=1 Tax=Sulfitobacter pontiacus TaxID=60137 RepID=UPI00326819F2
MLEPFLDHLTRAKTLSELDNVILSLSDELNVEHVVYHSVSSTGKEYAVTTYEPLWVDQYLGNNYARIDPVVQACVRRFTPVDWKNLDWTGKGTRNFLGEAIDSGVGNQGFSVPIRGPSGQFALFSVSSSDKDESWARYTNDYSRSLILASHYINQKALEIELGSDQANIVSLSPRETDALTLLAIGNNRAQAANSLSISEHTLRVYIESARFKLAASNTTHAVAKALNQGLLRV